VIEMAAKKATPTILKAYAAKIAKTWGYPPEQGPQVVLDWDGPGKHVIVWEDYAPYDWPQLLHGGIEEEFGFKLPAVPAPKGYWTEAVNHLTIALYPLD
jgi:hypothetical protein